MLVLALAARVLLLNRGVGLGQVLDWLRPYHCYTMCTVSPKFMTYIDVMFQNYINNSIASKVRLNSLFGKCSITASVCGSGSHGTASMGKKHASCHIHSHPSE
eukprot:4354912-Amphidinium_carterae.1